MKKWILLAFLMAFGLVTAVSASSILETQKVPKGDRHDMKEILPPSSKWEKMAAGNEVKGRFMEGINFDDNGDIWMVSPPTKEILKVSGSGVETEYETSVEPVGAKFHKDGRLFTTNRSGELKAYNPATGKNTVIVSEFDNERLQPLNDLVFDEKNGIYFTEPGGSHATKPTGRVFYLSPDGELTLALDHIAYPNGIAISADGQRVYVSEFATNRIISVPSVTAKDKREVPFVFAHLEGGIGPDGLAVDEKGNLYVAHFQAGEIVVLDKDGFEIGTIRLPEKAGTFVTNLTFNNGYLYITESSRNEVWRLKVVNGGKQE
ncbi:SMP-30/gluconolactonase/LRE family protein [Virgibacillus xinjiangensis]|uniref:SMP-30/gluconolactonase/LRE family protein n=1 Tax=Virgibacillus xinjiangensis TaxID=393090 RepID=A0ABV7CX79_9BACI